MTCVENLIRLCLIKKARLIHMSTVSVSGEALNGAAAEKELKECHLNIGQDVTSNAYVHTFEIRRASPRFFPLLR